MRYLLDTHVFLWLADGDPRLSPTVLSIFEDVEQACFLSTASIWEMAIKASLGKLSLGTSLARLVEGGVERGVGLLDVSARHSYLVETLPFHHRDPFDRMLVAQATHEGMQLISRDEHLDAYSVKRVW